MAIPITIDKLLTENIVERARIEFKEGWNPGTTLKTISAFANDIDNWGGGYIVIGAEEKDGKKHLYPLWRKMMLKCTSYIQVVMRI